VRVASAHLSDFHEQFHTQTISTISFAVAQLPLLAPEATGPVQRDRPTTTTPPPAGSRSTGANAVVRRRTTTPSPVLRASPALDTMAPPTGAMDLVSGEDDPGPSDTIIGMAEPPRVSDRRRRLLVISASAAIVLLAGFGLWGAIRGGETRPPVAPRIVPPSPPRPIVAALIAPPPPPTTTVPRTSGEAAEIEMTPDDPAPSALAGPQPTHRTPREAAHKPVHKDAKPPAVPPAASFTREQLAQKFQQVRHEYDDYKSKFGSRLEKEWGDLVTYIQYTLPHDSDAEHQEAARRFDAFRDRMRQ
jgi:hypothetical protein